MLSTFFRKLVDDNVYKSCEIGHGMIYESLEQIIILRQDSLIIILISGLVVRTDMRTFDNLFHFLEYLASFTHDGVEVFLELFYEW